MRIRSRPWREKFNKAVASLLSWATRYLKKNRIENPRLEAEILLAHLLQWDRIRLWLDCNRSCEREEILQYKNLISRRIKGEPLAYITGEKEFWSLRFKVDGRALIPRPETEILVEEALTSVPHNESVRILEIGTGCGAIAISLAKELEKASIIATDISSEALILAKENARIHGVEAKITFVCGNLFQSLERVKQKAFDLIISNPPYIPTYLFSDLLPEIHFEPRIALDGGVNGLEFYRLMIPEVDKYLTEGGWLMLEVGKDQAQKVARLMEEISSFCPPFIVKDLSGVERVVKVKNVRKTKTPLLPKGHIPPS